MSTERKFAMVAAVQGKLYAAGGDDAGDGGEGNVQRSVEAYDPQKNRWEAVASMDREHDVGAVAAI